MKNLYELHEAHRQAVCDVEQALRRILEKAGWTYSSDNPGALWLWSKKLPDGRIAMVSGSTALMFVERMEDCEDPDLDDSEQG